MVKSNRRGLSPVVATVLLIMIVIIIAIIIFLWFRSLAKEAVTKDLGFGEENIELVCDDVVMDVRYNNERRYLFRLYFKKSKYTKCSSMAKKRRTRFFITKNNTR